MKEIGLDFSRNEDSTIVKDEDGKIMKNLKRIYSDITLNLGFCYEQLKEGSLTEGMKETHLSLAESQMVDFLKELNFDSFLKKEREERYNKIRTVNEQNRELRKQLGEKVTNEDVRERVKNIRENVWHWWNIHGFGHISDFKIDEGGHIIVRFSGMITKGYCAEPEKTLEDKVKELKALGFEFIEDEDAIVISDKNIETLKTLITSKYPSAKITEITVCFRSSKRSYKDILVIIEDLNDIK